MSIKSLHTYMSGHLSFLQCLSLHLSLSQDSTPNMHTWSRLTTGGTKMFPHNFGITSLILQHNFTRISPQLHSNFGTTWLMYQQHFALSTVSQTGRIPTMNSSLLHGLTSCLKPSFNFVPHATCSWLHSGYSGGVCHQLTPWSLKKSPALADVCFRSLSWMNLCTFG